METTPLLLVGEQRLQAVKAIRKSISDLYPSPQEPPSRTYSTGSNNVSKEWSWCLNDLGRKFTGDADVLVSEKFRIFQFLNEDRMLILQFLGKCLRRKVSQSSLLLLPRAYEARIYQRSPEREIYWRTFRYSADCLWKLCAHLLKSPKINFRREDGLKQSQKGRKTLEQRSR